MITKSIRKHNNKVVRGSEAGAASSWSELAEQDSAGSSWIWGERHTERVRVTSVSGGRCSRWWGTLARNCCLMKPNSLNTVMCCCCCRCRWSLRGKRNSFVQTWPPCLRASHRFCTISTVAFSVPNFCTWVEYWSLIISTNWILHLLTVG